jgi:hypothetical protein
LVFIQEDYNIHGGPTVSRPGDSPLLLNAEHARWHSRRSWRSAWDTLRLKNMGEILLVGGFPDTETIREEAFREIFTTIATGTAQALQCGPTASLEVIRTLRRRGGRRKDPCPSGRHPRNRRRAAEPGPSLEGFLKQGRRNPLRGAHIEQRLNLMKQGSDLCSSNLF